MEVAHFSPWIEEPCPSASVSGLSLPTERQREALLERGSGRVNFSLRGYTLVQWGDAVGTLASAAVFRLLETGAATAPAGFGGLGNPDISIALADLSVSGSGNWAAFRRAATRDGRVDVPAFRQLVVDAVLAAVERIGVSLISESSAQIRAAVDHVVDRALEVIWALQGPVAHRMARRPGLGWVAVHGERDQPSRPVNVPENYWPTADLDVPVIHAGRRVTCRIRYAIAGGVEASTDVSVFDNLPDTTTPPSIPPDAFVIVFLHGHSSQLEEAFGFYRGMLNRFEEDSCFRHPFALIAFDFPTHGYSEYIDHEALSPLEATTRYVPDQPTERRFGMLEYYERIVVRFIVDLSARMEENGDRGILDRISAVVGGSMGGNLAMRLSEKLVTFAPWLSALVAWSPASVYPSFGRTDYLIPGPEEHFDPIAKEALERAHNRCRQAESYDTRREFIGLQMQGERLVNDGTPEFETTVRALAG